jgi:hypothetical protein
LRLIGTQSGFTMTESALPDNLTLAGTCLGCFRYLYHHRHFQRGSAPRAFRTLGHARHFALQLDVRGHGVSADGTVCQSLCVAFHQILHFQISLLFRRKSGATGLARHRKVF